jgi:hypothetical protein
MSVNHINLWEMKHGHVWARMKWLISSLTSKESSKTTTVISCHFYWASQSWSSLATLVRQFT